MIPTTADAVTDVRARGLCPECYRHGVLTIMQPAGQHAYICPRQREEERIISAAARARALEAASERVEGCSF